MAAHESCNTSVHITRQVAGIHTKHIKIKAHNNPPPKSLPSFLCSAEGNTSYVSGQYGVKVQY